MKLPLWGKPTVGLGCGRWEGGRVEGGRWEGGRVGGVGGVGGVWEGGGRVRGGWEVGGGRVGGVGSGKSEDRRRSLEIESIDRCRIDSVMACNILFTVFSS